MRSVRGYKYFVVYIHEGTRKICAVKAKKKREIPALTRRVLRKHKNVYGKHVIEFRSDNGSEFTAHPLQKYLTKNGITFNPSTPRTPEQNGMAERTIQTITTKIRTIIKQCGISLRYWCYALDYVVYTMNRIPHSADTTKTPHELYYKRKPDLSNLVVFGCIGVLSVDRELRNRRRMEDTGEYVRMLGYDTRYGTYVVCTNKGKIIEKANVDKWYQNVFRYSTLKKQLPQYRKEQDEDVELVPVEEKKHVDTRGENTTHSPEETKLVPSIQTSPPPETNGNDRQNGGNTMDTKSIIGVMESMRKEIMRMQKKMDSISTTTTEGRKEMETETVPVDTSAENKTSDEAGLIPITNRKRKQDHTIGLRVSKRSNKNVPPAIMGRNYGVYNLMDYQNLQDEEEYTKGEGGEEMSFYSEVKRKHLYRMYTPEMRDEERMFSSLDQTTGNVIVKDVDVTVHDILNLPRTFREAVTGPEKKYWVPSIKDEIKSLVQNHTWDVVRKSKDTKLVTTKWVFKKKLNPDGSIRYKSRLVARGFNQRQGVEWFRSYAPTLSLTSLRILLALCSKHKLDIHNIDIRTAYLYDQVDADIYLEIPKGLEINDCRTKKEREIMRDRANAACHLNKSIYGLKQSAYIWNRTLVRSLKNMGFKQLEMDPCLFVMNREVGGKRSKIIVGVYVDDTLLCFQNEKDMDYVLDALKKEYKLNYLGAVQECLGIQIEKDSRGCYSICQEKYIKRMCEKFKILPSKRAKTPIPEQIRADHGQEPKVDQTLYRSVIGACLHVAVATRPDIVAALSLLARHSQDPREGHLKMAYRVMKYLLNTKHYRISYSRTEKGMEGYADATHMTERDGKSRSGYFLQLYGGPILYASHRQTVVANHIAEAEYMSMSQLGRDIVYATQLIEEIGFGCKEKVPMKIPVFEDCQPAIQIATNPGFSKKSKSIRCAYHNIRQLIRDNTIRLFHISGKDQPADILTKPLGRTTTLACCRKFYANIRVN